VASPAAVAGAVFEGASGYTRGSLSASWQTNRSRLEIGSFGDVIAPKEAAVSHRGTAEIEDVRLVGRGPTRRM